MKIEQNYALLETINHVTGSLPFSFHHTIVGKNTESILYLHWHSEMEFLYIERGETLFCIEEKEYPMKAGDAIFIPPNLLHKAKRCNDCECEFYAFVFSPSFLSSSYTNPHYAKYIMPILHNNLRYSLQLTPDTSWHQKILINLKGMFELSRGDIGECELQVHGLLLIIWQLLFNHHLSRVEVTKNHFRLTAQLQEAINLIHCSYDEDITLSRLAHISNLSEGQFCRIFKQLTGFTPFGYINRYRIMESCKILSQTTKKVAEIATLCGYNNVSYFNREFIKIMKQTPSAYRKYIQ